MSFFPFSLWFGEDQRSLWVSDATLDLSIVPSEEDLLNTLAALLAKIEQAALRQLAFVISSENFLTSIFYPYHIVAFREIMTPTAVNLHCLLSLTHYIHSQFLAIRPQLFLSSSSIGSQMFVHTIGLLQSQIISHQSITLHSLEEPSTSTAPMQLLPVPTTPLPIPDPLPSHQPLSPPLYAELDPSSPKRKRLLSTNTDNDAPETKKRVSPDIVSAPLPDKQEKITPPEYVSVITSTHFHQSTPKSPLRQLLPLSDTDNINILPSSLNASDDSDIEEDLQKQLPSIEVATIIPQTTKRKKTAHTEKKISAAKTLTSCLQCPYITLRLNKLKTGVSFIARQDLFTKRELVKFLAKIKATARSCFFYKCRQTIPEIENLHPYRKENLLRALYAIVCRNHFFFIQQQPSLASSVRMDVNNTLTMLNNAYQERLKDLGKWDDEKSTTASDHHPDLSAYTIDPLHPPESILFPSFLQWLHIYSHSSQPNHLWIKPSHLKQWREPFRSVKDSLTKILDHCKRCKEEEKQNPIFIRCKNPNYILDHVQKNPLEITKVIKILKTVITTNEQHFYERHPSTTISSSRFTEVQSLFAQLTQFLDDWNTKTSSTHIGIEASSEDIKEIASEGDENEDPSSEGLTQFITINYNPRHNSFSVFTESVFPCQRRFLSFLKTVKGAIYSDSYNCDTPIPELTLSSTKDRLDILKTLFFITSKYAYLYLNATPQSKKSITISETLSNTLFSLLQSINTVYCEQLPDYASSSKKPYHPDLQEIADSYDIILFKEKTTPMLSFTFPYLNIDIPNNAAQIVFRTMLEKNPKKLIQRVAITLKYIGTNIIDITRSSPTTLFSFSSPDNSYLIDDTASCQSILRNKALSICLDVLLKFDMLLKDTPFITKTMKEIGNKKIPLYLKTLPLHINAAIQNAPPPQEPLPSGLEPFLSIYSLHISKQSSEFHSKIKRFYSQSNNQNLKAILTHSQITNKWLIQWLEGSLPTKSPLKYFSRLTGNSLIIEKNETAIYSFLPFFYHSCEQTRLQITQFLRTKKLPPKSVDNLNAALTYINDNLTLLKTKWQSLQKESSSPPFSLISAAHQADLCLSEASMQQLQEDLNTLPETTSHEPTEHSPPLFPESP